MLDKKKKPYKTINKALDAGCDNIIVEAGEYIEDIDIDSGRISSIDRQATIKGAVIVSGIAGLKDIRIG